MIKADGQQSMRLSSSPPLSRRLTWSQRSPPPSGAANSAFWPFVSECVAWRQWRRLDRADMAPQHRIFHKERALPVRQSWSTKSEPLRPDVAWRALRELTLQAVRLRSRPGEQVDVDGGSAEIPALRKRHIRKRRTPCTYVAIEIRS